MTIKVLLDELVFLNDESAWAYPPLRGTLTAYAIAFRPVADVALERYAVPRGSRTWFVETASHAFLTYLTRRLGFKMTITSAKQFPNEALGMVARWLDGHHPDWSVEDEIDILDAAMERRHKFVVNLIGAICPKERP